MEGKVICRCSTLAVAQTHNSLCKCVRLAYGSSESIHDVACKNKQIPAVSRVGRTSRLVVVLPPIT